MQLKTKKKSKEEILSLFDKWEKRKSDEFMYRLPIGEGENIIYFNGFFGMYWRSGNNMDQGVTWIKKEKALELIAKSSNIDLAEWESYEYNPSIYGERP